MDISENSFQNAFYEFRKIIFRSFIMENLFPNTFYVLEILLQKLFL